MAARQRIHMLECLNIVFTPQTYNDMDNNMYTLPTEYRYLQSVNVFHHLPVELLKLVLNLLHFKIKFCTE